MMHKAKKSLGQNFLKSEIALKKIIEAGNVGPDDTILEIGPGKGALTKKLLEKAGLVIAIEKDRELFELLKEHNWPEELASLAADAVGCHQTANEVVADNDVPASARFADPVKIVAF